jgi:hypothetical protein
MENIPTPPHLDDTISDISYNLSAKQINDNDIIKIMFIHELRVLNFYMAEIEASLKAIANDK